MKKSLLLLFLLINALGLQAQELEIVGNLVRSKDLKKIAAADVQFHDIIYQATGNPKLVNMLNNLREQMYRYRVEYLKDERNYPTLMREHSEIVEGLMTKDKGRVTEAMHKHVKNQVVAVKEMIREQE